MQYISYTIYTLYIPYTTHSIPGPLICGSSYLGPASFGDFSGAKECTSPRRRFDGRIARAQEVAAYMAVSKGGRGPEKRGLGLRSERQLDFFKGIYGL